MPLRSQLLKAGVATQKQARRAQHQKRQEQGQQQSAAKLAQQRRAEQAERSRQLNEQRQAALREREQQAEIQQLIDTHAVSRAGGEHSYQFVMHQRVNKILVPAPLIEALAKGRMGIVHWQDAFHVLPAEALERIAQRDNSVIVVWHQHTAQPEEEDPYAAYPIPDDLMW